MKIAAVTGANGFIGSAVVKELLLNDYYVYALVHKNTSNIPEDKNLKKIPYLIDDFDDVKKNIEECDIFFHFAWSGSAGPERGDVELQLKNALDTVNAVKLAKDLNCGRFVGAGSITEHETIHATWKKENRLGMNYIYGGGKLAAHIMSKTVAANIDMDFLWGEITNAYGPGEMNPRLINTTLRKIIRGESPRFSSGAQNYDFVYIDDVARAFRLIGENGKSFSEYVIGSSDAKPLRDFLLEIKDHIGENVDFFFGDLEFEGVNMPLSAFNCASTEEDTGFKANINFKEGIKRTMEWLKDYAGIQY